MKRQILKALTVLLIISALTGGMAACGKKEKAQMSDGTFTVGFDAEFPPYGYKDESGEYVGFDLDLAQEVCNRNGWTLVKQPIDWDSKDMELNSGTISCIWNGFTMDGREDEYTWSSAYVDNSQVVVVEPTPALQSFPTLLEKLLLYRRIPLHWQHLREKMQKKQTVRLRQAFSPYSRCLIITVRL